MAGHEPDATPTNAPADERPGSAASWCGSRRLGRRTGGVHRVAGGAAGQAGPGPARRQPPRPGPQEPPARDPRPGQPRCRSARSREGMRVEVDHVYVIPPGTSMALVDGHLTLDRGGPGPCRTCRSTTCSGRWPPSRRAGPSASILSGNGSDGAIALQTIKAVGGSPSPRTRRPRYPSMPRAAALDGNVDHVLRPRDIARELDANRPPPVRAARPTAGADRARRVGDPIIDILEPVAATHGRRFHPLQADDHPPPHPPPDGAAQPPGAARLPGSCFRARAARCRTSTRTS